MVLPVLKPMTLNLDLIYDEIAASAFSRNIILMGQSGIFRSVPMKYCHVTFNTPPLPGS